MVGRLGGPWTMEGRLEWTIDHRPYLPADAKASAMAGGDHGRKKEVYGLRES